ncbi:MAG: DUF3179 domain-containing protein [Chloroflexota bacterium]
MARYLFLVALLMLAACNPGATVEEETAVSPTVVPAIEEEAAPTEEAATEAAAEEEMAEPTEEAAMEEAATAAPVEEVVEEEAMEEEMEEETAVSIEPIDDDEARLLLNELAFGTEAEAQAAVERIVAADDKRFVAAFIEMFRNAQIGIIRSLPPAYHIEVLEGLSGQEFGFDWGGWIEWYGGTDLEPPPHFTAWKGRMLSIIDPGFGEFLRDGLPSRIRVEEIQWGGVVVDGIPALDHSPMISPETADYMNPTDAVFGMEINGDARAYPLRIMDWHEMANDTIGGVPVSIAYCTLCGAAVAYDGRASDGNTYDFGSSGFLFRSNKLMYDRQTRTLWNQLTGEPVLGELVDTDVTLPILPIVLTTWEEWLADHPDTVVLDVETNFRRDYGPGAAYGDYFSSPGTMFPVWQREDLLETKAHVYALRLNGLPKAYPVEIVNFEQVVNDMLAETAVVLVSGRDQQVEIEGKSRRAGAVTYTAGGEIRAFERGDHEFAAGDDSDTVVDENGRSWQVTEDALVGPDGETLPRLGGHLAYWFGWYAFFPQTEIYGVEEG